MSTPFRNFAFVLVLATLAVPARASDFNGDGRADLVIAVDLPASGGAYRGAIEILFAQSNGLSTNDLALLLSPLDADYGSATDASFGDAIASGDFDGDGFDDLAVGAPYAPVHGVIGAGLVAIFRGAAGMSAPPLVLHQDVASMKDKCETNDRFGASLAAGDFDGDGYADLAIGVHERVGGKPNAGAVHVVYGSKQGLTAKRDVIWTQNSGGIKDSAETNDAFGAVLSAGDLDGDGKQDLLVGVPGEIRKHAGLSVTGSVAILRGEKHGLSCKNNVLFDGFDFYAEDTDVEADFGAALAIGDFDGNGIGDVIVGCPGWDLADEFSDEGMLFIIPWKSAKVGKLDPSHGLALGLTTAMRLGSSLTVGDFTGDGRPDLAFGIPLCTSMPGVKFAGAVGVIPGNAYGPDYIHTQWITRNTQDVIGDPKVAANFGHALASADFDGDGFCDLAVSSPYDTVNTADACGSINVLRGIGSGVTGTNSQYFDGLSFGFLWPYEWFGLTLDS